MRIQGVRNHIPVLRTTPINEVVTLIGMFLRERMNPKLVLVPHELVRIENGVSIPASF